MRNALCGKRSDEGFPQPPFFAFSAREGEMDAFKFLCIIWALYFVISAEARGKGSRSALLRQPAGAATTGSYFIVLRDKTNEEEMEQTMASISKLAEDSRIGNIIKKVSKAFTVKLSPLSLELVSTLHF